MGFKREDIRDTSPLSLKKLNDTLRYLWLHSFGNIDFADLSTAAQGVINNKVSSGDFSSLIEQNPDSVKIGVGQIGGNNVAFNGDFEFDNLAPVYYYDLNVAMWENQTGVYSTAPSGDTSSDKSKFFYMRILHNEMDGVIGTLLYYINKKFAVKPNTKYTFSCDIQSMNCKAMYGVSYYDSSDVRIGYEELGGEFHSTWSRHNWSGVSPNNAAYAKAFFSIVPLNNGAWQEYRAEFDKFKMEEGDNATAWGPNANELKNSTTEITDEHFRFTNNDGSYVELNPASSGLKWHKGAVSMDYHYLTHVGQATCVAGGVTITLPDEFKNKNFSIIPSIKALSRPGDYPDSQLTLFNCYVYSIDYVNATAVIVGYSTWNDSSGAYFSYPEVSYIAIA